MKLLKIGAGLLALLIFLMASIRTSASGAFITHNGPQFTLNGQPYYVGGTNNHYIAWASKTEIDNMLTDAAALHFNVVRTFASVMIGSTDHSSPTIWNYNQNGDPSNMGMEGTYFAYWDTQSNQMAFNDTSSGLQHIDYILYKAHSLNLHILLAVNDFHWFTGGLQQMSTWFGRTSGPFDNYNFAFTNKPTRAAYKSWATHLINHVNIYTGIAYRDDPTIFAWEIANEPACNSETALYNWLADLSSYIKSLDHNHLLASGDEGSYHIGGMNPYTEWALPAIDFGTVHTYPVYTKLTIQQTQDMMSQRCAIGTSFGKPVLIEEFGYPASQPNQTGVYRQWLDNLTTDPNCAGWLVWRLTAIENSGSYPRDNGQGYDFHNDGSLISQLLSQEADSIQHKNRPPTSTATPSPTYTQTAQPSSTLTSTPIMTALPTCANILLDPALITLNARSLIIPIQNQNSTPIFISGATIHWPAAQVPDMFFSSVQLNGQSTDTWNYQGSPDAHPGMNNGSYTLPIAPVESNAGAGWVQDSSHALRQLTAHTTSQVAFRFANYAGDLQTLFNGNIRYFSGSSLSFDMGSGTSCIKTFNALAPTPVGSPSATPTAQCTNYQLDFAYFTNDGAVALTFRNLSDVPVTMVGFQFYWTTVHAGMSLKAVHALGSSYADMHSLAVWDAGSMGSPSTASVGNLGWLISPVFDINTPNSFTIWLKFSDTVNYNSAYGENSYNFNGSSAGLPSS